MLSSMLRPHAVLGAIIAILLAIASLSASGAYAALPIIANTWAFTNATDAAWRMLQGHAGAASAALRAVEQVLLLYVARRQATSICNHAGQPMPAI